MRPDSDARSWDVVPSCPLSVFSKRVPGGVLAGAWTVGAFVAEAPPGAVLDRMVIWRTGFEFFNYGAGVVAWEAVGYAATTP